MTDVGPDALGSLVPNANAAIDGDAAATQALAESVAVLMSLEPAVERLTTYRPERALRGTLRRLAKSLATAADELISAFEADDIATMRRHGEGVQPAIDEATNNAAGVRQVFDAWHIAHASEDPLSSAMALAAEWARHQGDLDNILDFAAAGQRAVAGRMNGSKIPAEYGPTVAAIAAFADLYFDADEFWAYATWQANILGSSSAEFSKLCDQPVWRRYWVQALEQCWDASTRFATLLPTATTARQNVSFLLDHCHDLQEGLAKTVLATARTVWRSNVTFEESLATTLPRHVEWLRAHGPSTTTAFDTPSRNAKAHNDWRVEEDTVVLCELRPPPSGPARLTPAMLVDHGLHILETTLAMFVGTIVAAGKSTVPLPSADHLADGSWPRYCVAILRASGWTSASVELAEDGVVRISGSASRLISLSDLASIRAYLPDGTRTVTAVLSTPLGQRHVVAELHHLAARDHADEDARALLFMWFLRASTCDGVPFVDEAQFRKLVANHVVPWVTKKDDDLGVLAVFKAARAAARECGDEALHLALRTAQGWRLDRLGGGTRPVSQLDPLMNWLGAPVPNLDISF